MHWHKQSLDLQTSCCVVSSIRHWRWNWFQHEEKSEHGFTQTNIVIIFSVTHLLSFSLSFIVFNLIFCCCIFHRSCIHPHDTSAIIYFSESKELFYCDRKRPLTFTYTWCVMPIVCFYRSMSNLCVWLHLFNVTLCFGVCVCVCLIIEPRKWIIPEE